MRRAAKKGRKAEFRPIRHIAGLPDAAFHVKARQTWPLSLPSALPLCQSGQNSAFGQGGAPTGRAGVNRGREDDAGRFETKHPTPSHVRPRLTCKLFDDGDGKAYDTIAGRKRRLGLAA